MENRINVAELLRDCPTGMELDCLMYDNVYLKCIREHAVLYPIVCYTIDSKGEKEEITFNWYGKYALRDTAKCVIFPKGKTTWEGFHRPFKGGDIVALDSAGGSQVFIFEEYIRGAKDYAYCYLMLDDNGEVDLERGEYYVERFATEEEKARLFQAIKDNGYRWNAETKTLEKFPEPLFKVGNKVRHKNNHGVVFTITSIEEDSYVCGAKAAFWFDDQDDYELVPNKFDTATLKPFESRVLVRDSAKDRWYPEFFGCLCDDYDYPYMIIGGTSWKCCIPFEGNEHLMLKTDDCDEYYKTWANEEE